MTEIERNPDRLVKDVEDLRRAISEMIPIIDWAKSRAEHVEKDSIISRYITATAKVVGDVLRRTGPHVPGGGNDD